MQITPIRILILVLCVLSIMNVANARAPGSRREHQHDRIQQGVRNGELTTREAVRLHDEQQRVREAAKAARADGTVTEAERNVLKAQRDRASANIYLQKHDGQSTDPRSRDGVRNVNQRERIHDGVQSGALTPEERARLNQQHRHIRRAETKAHADGVVTEAEAKRLEALQDRASANIYLQKHDAEIQDAPPAPAAAREPASVQTESYGGDVETMGAGAAR